MSEPARGQAVREALRERVLLLDGGLGSLLLSAGLEAGRAPEHWVFDHPEHIVTAHRRYVEAGCDIIHTVTFGASPHKLAAVGLGGRCAEVNERAVALARKAAGDRAWVAGDLGPTGAFLPPMGAATGEELVEAYRKQAAALAEAGVDLLSIETMFDKREALAALEAARATGLPVFASMTFEERKRGFFTIMGDPLVPTLQALADGGADAVGFNCSVTSGPMVKMVEAAVAELSVPVVAQPNAGQPRATTGGVVYDASPEDYVTDVMRMVSAGARVVGGCCGTEPGFLRAARIALDVRDPR